ncbi:MAG: uL14 family ribosomal protein [Candidatus Aenigmarchaeota archaeon]|nr:uL14 family ribosomal protein [Candidatus Aenigmarchaeota archaeon]
MKPISSHITKTIPIKARMVCADNSGAKILEVINVKGYKGVKRRYPRCGVGDVVICSVKKGKEKLVGTVVYAVVVRQRKEYRRADGSRVKFIDNAAILVNPKTTEPLGTEIRSVIAKEVVERFSPIGKIASIVL